MLINSNNLEKLKDINLGTLYTYFEKYEDEIVGIYVSRDYSIKYLLTIKAYFENLPFKYIFYFEDGKIPKELQNSQIISNNIEADFINFCDNSNLFYLESLAKYKIFFKKIESKINDSKQIILGDSYFIILRDKEKSIFMLDHSYAYSKIPSQLP